MNSIVVLAMGLLSAGVVSPADGRDPCAVAAAPSKIDRERSDDTIACSTISSTVLPVNAAVAAVPPSLTAFLALEYLSDHRAPPEDWRRSPGGPRSDLSLRTEEDSARAVAAGPRYVVGPGDVLEVVVWRNPELSRAVTVRPDGRLTIPLVEDLYVEGKTSGEIARDVQDEIAGFIQDPFVTVIVRGLGGASVQQIRVIGEALQPASVPYSDGMRILDVIVAIDGISPFADGNSALIIRGAGDEARQIPLRLDDLLDDGDSSANVKMAPGDVVLIPEGFFNGDWRLQSTATFNQTLSDNIDRDPIGEENPAVVTEAGTGLSGSITTARINAALTSNTQVRQQFLHDAGAELRGQIDGTSTIEFLEDFLFLDASVTSSRQTLDTASSGADADQEQVTTLSVSPFIRNEFGSFAESEVRLSWVSTLTDSDEVSTDTTTEASFQIESGRDFTSYLWAFTGSISETDRSEEEAITEREIEYSNEYVVSREFSLLGAIGYQFRDDEGDEDDVDGPTWELGFRWRPGPRTDLRLTYGERDDDTSVNADFTYRPTSRTTFNLTYAEELETSQERLQQDLAAIGIDPDTGALVDTRNDQAFSPNTSPFSIENETRRTRRLNASLVHQKRRDSFLVGLQAEEESTTEGSVDETTIQANASWTRELDPSTTMVVSGTLRYSDMAEDDRIDQDVIFRSRLSHRLYADVDGFAVYDFARRFSDDTEEEFIENRVQVGVNIRF